MCIACRRNRWWDCVGNRRRTRRHGRLAPIVRRRQRKRRPVGGVRSFPGIGRLRLRRMIRTGFCGIEEQLRPRGGNAGSYVAPRTETEEMLCRLWQSLLRVERVGIRDNFFELGGHSLLAVRLFAEVEKLTGKKLPLVTLFQHSTVEQLALMIEQRSGAVRSSLVAIQAHGTRPPLFLIHGAGGDVLWGY